MTAAAALRAAAGGSIGKLDSATISLLVNCALLQGLRIFRGDEVSRFGVRLQNLVSDPFDGWRQLITHTLQELRGIIGRCVNREKAV